MNHTEYLVGKCWNKFGLFIGNSEIKKPNKRLKSEQKPKEKYNYNLIKLELHFNDKIFQFQMVPHIDAFTMPSHDSKSNYYNILFQITPIHHYLISLQSWKSVLRYCVNLLINFQR